MQVILKREQSAHVRLSVLTHLWRGEELVSGRLNSDERKKDIPYDEHGNYSSRRKLGAYTSAASVSRGASKKNSERSLKHSHIGICFLPARLSNDAEVPEAAFSAIGSSAGVWWPYVKPGEKVD